MRKAFNTYGLILASRTMRRQAPNALREKVCAAVEVSARTRAARLRASRGA